MNRPDRIIDAILLDKSVEVRDRVGSKMPAITTCGRTESMKGLSGENSGAEQGAPVAPEQNVRASTATTFVVFVRPVSSLTGSAMSLSTSSAAAQVPVSPLPMMSTSASSGNDPVALRCVSEEAKCAVQYESRGEATGGEAG